MASNKFFPWNKTDKRQLDSSRSGVVVPIPIECISIKGLDCEIAPKALGKDSHRPPPLSLDVIKGHVPSRIAPPRTQESQMLQDAAVQSATSLIAVMNEMLKSPQLSNFITAHQNSRMLEHGRGRANTAPTTPVAEAPSFELAELPGSVPSSLHLSMSRPSQSVDGRSLFSATLASSNSSIMGRSIDRLRGSPQNSHYSFSAQHRRSAEASTARSRSAGPSRGYGHYQESYDFNEDVMSRADTPFYHQRRMSENNTPVPPSGGFTRPEMFRADSNLSGVMSIPNEQDTEYGLIQQIDEMRAAHEAHTLSLKESHERELQSLRTYLAILEKRRVASQPSMSQSLTLDIARSAARPGDQSASTAGTSASVQSFESSLENQRRSNDLLAENEALKRKLSLSRKAQADLGDIRRERDVLRSAADNDRRRIGQLKDIVRKAKDDIKSLRSATDDLEARLVAANNERLDAIEEFQQAAEKVHKLTLREDELLHDREELCTRLFDADPSWDGVVLGKAADKPHENAPSTEGNDHEQIKELQRQMAEKDARIAELEQNNSAEKATHAQTRTVDELILIAERAEFQEQLQLYRDKVAYAETERDKYNSLLHAELRRQMRNSMKNPGSLTPKINNEIASTTADRISSARGPSDSPLEPPSEAGLEVELQKCIEEIIMYKLDIKGYKKDIKRANAEIQGLRSGGPTTPDPGTLSRSTTSRHRATGSEGLGISVSDISAARTPSLPSSAIDNNKPHSFLGPATRRPSAANALSAPSMAPNHHPSRAAPETQKQLPAPPPPPPAGRSPRPVSRQPSSANTSIKIDRHESSSHRTHSDPTTAPSRSSTILMGATTTAAAAAAHNLMLQTAGHLPRGRNSLPPRPFAETLSPRRLEKSTTAADALIAAAAAAAAPPPPPRVVKEGHF